MRRAYRFVISLVLTAALVIPVAMMAATSTIADKDKKHDDKQDEKNQRYYDKKHKDYHTWDNNEDMSYHRYQTEHREKRPFIQLNTRQQNSYWNWRHSNPDNR
jgi:hypothetical protein